MNVNKSTGQRIERSVTTNLVRKRMLQVVATILISAVILFGTSGKLDWVMAWVYIGTGVCIVLFNSLLILPKSPEMIAERAQIKEGTKSWDRVLTSFMTGSSLIILIVAGLNTRFEWLPKLALSIQFIALLCFVLGNGIWSWAMVSNKFFSGTVRIQKERGHTVITTGAYRFVRHPGYLGFIIFSMATPLLLGSLWALIPAMFTVSIVVIRTILEDRALQEELNGYEDYANRVRYRLISGVW